METINLVWLRRDLRLHDNQLFTTEILENKASVFFFIWDEDYLDHSEASVKRAQFLLESLKNLREELDKQNCKLRIFYGKSKEIIFNLLKLLNKENKLVRLIFSREAEVAYSTELDESLLKNVNELNCKVKLCTNNFLLTRESEMDSWREQYYAYQKAKRHKPAEKLIQLNSHLQFPKETSLEEIEKLLPGQKFNLFKGGEVEANRELNNFLQKRAYGYHWKLSRPWLAQMGATSHLSPHVYFGTISTRDISQRVRQAIKDTDNSKYKFSLKAFLDRIRWRDSFTQRLYFHPEIIWQNRHREFDAVYCKDELPREKQALLTAWQEGQTGFPLIDASMRHLLENGWMNFRMRSMCATFLTINCGISWHHGAEYFMKHLIDADYAINNWQWQMQAGITNPLSETSQHQKLNATVSRKMKKS